MARRCVGVFFAVWKRVETNASFRHAYPKYCFRGAGSGLATRQSFARVSVDTSDPINAGGVDVQMAFYATGLPEPFQDMFALDPVEALEVVSARVVDWSIVDFWNGVVYPVLAVVPVKL